MISIHSLRMEGDDGISIHYGHKFISIHSLRMEGDRCGKSWGYAFLHFNPLPPHGGRLLPMRSFFISFRFQSTPSAWRETSTFGKMPVYGRDFNPLPPHGGRRENVEIGGKMGVFQSTPSAWRETVAPKSAAAHEDISIHSLRMEGDFPALYTNPLG